MEGYLYSFDLDLAAEIAYAQRFDGIWREVYNQVEFLMDPAGNNKGEELAWLMATASSRARGEQHLLRGYRRVLSRSTSVIGNIQEDFLDQAWAQFLDDTKYMRVNDLLNKMGEV